MKLMTGIILSFIVGHLAIWAGELIRVPIISKAQDRPFVFELNVSDGSVEIHGTDDGDYYWEAEIDDKQEGFLQKVMKANPEENRLRLRFGEKIDVDSFRACVPPNTIARVRAIDGDVTVQGLLEESVVEAVDGDVTLVDVGPDVTVNAVDGDIDVSLRRDFDGDGRMSLASVDGDIAIKLYSKLGFKAKVSTLDGDLDVDETFETKVGPGKWMQGDGSEAVVTHGDERVKIDASTVDGDVEIALNE